MKDFRVIDGGDQDLFDREALPVVHADLVAIEEMLWQDLFSGFDELYAMTYSVGVKQVEDVMEHFKHGEVIIGSPSQIHALPAQIFAKQQYDIGYFSRNETLQKRVEDGSFHFYVTNGSHSKVYLLKASDGRRRVITTSANFSACAWDGSQQENYTYVDSQKLFDYYYGIFEDIRRESSDEIGIDAKEISNDGKNLDDLPVFRKIIQHNEAIVIHDVANKEEQEYIYQTTEDVKKWARRLNEAGISPDKDNVITIDPKKVTRMKQVMKEEHSEKTRNLILNPELLIDYRKKTAAFAEKEMDLQPKEDDVRQDIENLLLYMQGTKEFTGDTAELRTTYWKILIYMFSAPFIAPLRYCYREIAPANSVGRPFPMYMILRGGKNGGKSSIVKTIQCMMFGKALAKLPPSVISPKSFEEYLLQIKGCPILIDDVTNNRLKYLKDIVKNEDTLLRAGVINHGCYILTSNESEKVEADVAKRVIVFNIRNQLSDDAAIQKDSSLHSLQKRMGTSLYRKYLAYMMPKVEHLIDNIKNEGTDSSDLRPDVFKLSSETLMEIFNELEIALPPELRVYLWQDFMGEAIKADKAVNIIRQAYAIAPEVFTVNKEKDLLLMDLSKANLSPKDIESLKNELPVDTARTCVGSTLPIKLSAIVKYAGIDFQQDNGWLAKLHKWFRGN